LTVAATAQTKHRDGEAPHSDGELFRRAAKITAAAVVVVALAFGLWRVREIIILLLLALTFAAAVRPGVQWLRARKVPESLSILIFFVLGLGTVALFFWLAVPPALHQISHALSNPAPTGSGGVRDRLLVWLQHHLKRLPSGTQLVHPVATYGRKAGEVVVSIFFTLAATWYLISDRDSIIEFLTKLSPEQKRDKARTTYLEIDRRLGSYTRLRFLMVIGVGTVLAAGFYVIGLNYWLLVGGFVGVAEIVPIVGPLVGAILVLAVGLPQSLHIALLSLLWLYIVRLIQDYVVNPHLAVQTVGLSPLVTLISVSVVGVLFGSFAVVLAVPVTAAAGALIDVLVLDHEPPEEKPHREHRGKRGARDDPGLSTSNQAG
jgi:predicted PurR-regulated permease PerM